MFRLRIESPPEDWRSFRWTFYLLVAGIAPLTVAGAVSLDGPFGRELLALLPFLYGMSAFGVEYTIHMGKQTQTVGFDAEGIHFLGPGAIARTFTWRRLTRVHVRALGPRDAPTTVAMEFREGFLRRWVQVDLKGHREVAERVAGYVALGAPGVRRTGRTEIVGWNPSLASDGDAVVEPTHFPATYFAGLGFFGPFANLYFGSVAVLFGFTKDRVVGLAMVAAYILLGVCVVAYCRSSARGKVASAPHAATDRWVSTLLALGGGCVAVQGVLLFFVLSS